MNFEPTEEQLLIQQAARDFAAREIEPKATELDKTGRWPTEIVARMAELGFLGMMVPDRVRRRRARRGDATCWRWRRSARLARRAASS